MLVLRLASLGLGCAAALALSGCSIHRGVAANPPPQELSGFYTSGPGASWFRPCGAAASDPSWWVTFTGASVAEADAARQAGKIAPGKRVFVRLLATTTLDGRVGPQGKGTPAVLVDRLLEAREATDADCPAAAPSAGSGS
jgi:hypothetical protein